MAEKGRRTRERMVELASEILERSGYHGLSLGELVSNAGAPRGSLYHHFPGGKDELVAEALDRAADELVATFRVVADAAPSAADAVATILDLLAGRMERAAFRKGCPIAATALDAGRLAAPIATRAEQAYVRLEALLGQRLREDGFHEDEADELAVFALAAIEGALLLARAERRRAPIDAVKRRLVALLARPV